MIDSFQHSPLSFNNNNNNKWSTLDDLKKNFVSICMQSIKTPPAQYDNELFEPFIYLTMTMCELKIQNENSQNNNDKHAFLEAILTQLSNTSYVDDLYAALLGSATTVAAGTTEGSEPWYKGEKQLASEPRGSSVFPCIVVINSFPNKDSPYEP